MIRAIIEKEFPMMTVNSITQEDNQEEVYLSSYIANGYKFDLLYEYITRL